MITLLIWMCVAGTVGDDQCDIKMLAQGFSNQKQCEVFAPLMVAGFEKMNEGYEVKRTWCVPNPEFFLNRFKA